MCIRDSILTAEFLFKNPLRSHNIFGAQNLSLYILNTNIISSNNINLNSYKFNARKTDWDFRLSYISVSYTHLLSLLGPWKTKLNSIAKFCSTGTFSLDQYFLQHSNLWTNHTFYIYSSVIQGTYHGYVQICLYSW